VGSGTRQVDVATARTPSRRRWHPGLFPCRADAHEDERKGLRPAAFLAADSCLQLSVEMLHHPIGCWVIGGFPDVASASQDIQVFEQERLNLPSVVRGDLQRYPETANPRLEEITGHRGSLLVRNGHSFRPPGETVDHCQAVLLTLGWWHDDEV
jgi:hypothetical protein